MKLTILGSGTVVPNGERNSAGFFVETRDARVMLDCGAGTVHALARFGLPWEQMTHLFISHFHVDHAGELASLFFAFKYGMRLQRSAPLTLIGPQGLDRLLEGLKSAFRKDLFEPKFPVQVVMLAPGERVQLDSRTTLSVTKTLHTTESLAARIDSAGRSLCYTGDTSYSDEVADFFAFADTVISECSFLDDTGGTRHLTASDAAKMATRARASRLIVTHFYFDVEEAALESRLRELYAGEVIIGRDGLSLEV